MKPDKNTIHFYLCLYDVWPEYQAWTEIWAISGVKKQCGLLLWLGKELLTFWINKVYCHPVLHHCSTLISGFDGFPFSSVGLSLTPCVTICVVCILHSPQLLVLVHCLQPCLPWATARYTSFYVQFCDSVDPVTASAYMAIPSESAILHSRLHRWQLHPFEQGDRGNSIL